MTRKISSQLALLNLEDLWMLPHVPGGDVKISAEETDAEFDVYCQKYGNREGIRRFMMDHGASIERDYDAMAKRVNTVLYRRLSPCVSGSAEYVSKFSRRYAARQKELYGDNYNQLTRNGGSTPELAKPLLDDALRTGKWKELPDELQDEYRRLAGGQA